ELNVEQLNRMPLRCPFGECEATITSSEILGHVLAQHLRPTSADEEELNLTFEGERTVLEFDLTQLKPQQTFFLGVLLYGGKRDDPGGLPANRGLCCLNRFKPEAKDAEILAEYLPVLVLVRRCYFFEWLDNQKKDDPKAIKDEELDMFLFWTQSAYCTRPLHITMTVYDRTMSECRSALRQVVNSGMIHPELDGKQLPKHKHALWVTYSEMAQMGKSKGSDPKKVQLELILHEYIK
ncbi:hypothetical protein KR026_002143, partial [Drosophila bipectinata]